MRRRERPVKSIAERAREGIARCDKILANLNPSGEDLLESGCHPDYFERARLVIAQYQAKEATKH